MNELANIYRGKSFSIGFTIPAEYDKSRIEDLKVNIGTKVYQHTIVQGVIGVNLTSNDTAKMVGRQDVVLTIEDSSFGVQKLNCGYVYVSSTISKFQSESFSDVYDVMVMLSFYSESLAVDHVLFDYLKGKSAYEYAVEGGYEGTEEQFYLDLAKAAIAVPYTGADKDVDLGANGITLDDVSFNENPTGAIDALHLQYSPAEKTLEFGLADGGRLQIGKEMFEEYTNIDTIALTNGMIVSTAAIPGNRKGIKRTDFTSLTSIRSIVGMVTVASIGTNQSGRVTTKGVINDLNTNGIAEGSQLWGNPSVLGGWSGSKPAKPQYAVQIGQVVVSSAMVGSVELNIAKDVKVGDLADVLLHETTDGQVAVYEESTGLWKNKSEVKINSIVPLGGALDVDGGLTADTVNADAVDTTSITSTNGFVKPGRTDTDVLLAGGGHKTLIDLYKGVYKVWKPDGSAAIIEINAAGQVLISGDIIVNGETYKLDAQEITTSEEQITLRSDAVGGLPIGALSGFRIKKYDGVNDGMIVIDKDGVLRIGDEGSEQPVLTREESPVSNGFLYYDSTDVRAETIPASRTKTNVADADLFPLADSEASNLPKFIDGANFKERLKEYVGSDFLFYLGNDDISVTVGVGEHVFVTESTTGYPSVILRLQTT